jgi:polyisoprenoid-binding protein YceI
MTTLWKADPAHSEVQFKVKHLMITTVTGYFRRFDLEVETEDEDFTKAKRIEFMADAGSIDTNSEQRDTHLRSADFFDVEKFGQVTFSGRTLEPAADGYRLTGDLTIRGVSKAVSVNVQFGGLVVDPYGQRKAGFEVQGKINRKEFGLVWSAMTEAGQVVVGDEIRIFCEIQLIKQLEANVHDRRTSVESNAY